MIHRSFKFIFLAMLAVAVASPAFAQMSNPEDFYNNLTPENIKAFVQKTDAISTGQMTDMQPQDIADYMNDHLADQGKFRSDTSFTLPGAAPRTDTETLTKPEFITNVLKGQGMIKNDQTQIDIQDLKISDDKKSATMKTISIDHGTLSFPGTNGQQNVPIAGQSTCTESVDLSKKNYIEMTGADCTTSITVSGGADTAKTP